MKMTIRHLRLSRDMTIQDLAVELGVTTGSVWGWEAMRSRPGDKNLQKLADYFGVPVEEIEVAPSVRAGRKPMWGAEVVGVAN